MSWANSTCSWPGMMIMTLPWSLTLMEMQADSGDGPGTVTAVHNFLAPYLPSLFRSFELPERLGEADPVIA